MMVSDCRPKSKLQSIDIPLKHGRMKGDSTKKQDQEEYAVKKKNILFVLITLFVMCFISGCKQNVGTPEDNAVVEETVEDEDETGGHVYGFSAGDLSDPFYEVLKESVSSMAEEEESRMLVRDAEGDPGLQNTQIQELIDEGVEALFLCPADPSAVTPALEALDEADIPVINLCVRAESADLTEAFIGADDYNAGKVCGDDLVGRQPEGGSLIIVDRPGAPAINERINGFEEAVAGGGFDVERIDAGDDYSSIAGQLEAVLKEKPQMNAIMCGDDQMAEQVLAALKDMARDDILVYSAGGSPEIKSALADLSSPMTGVGAVSPINMGKTAAKTAAAILGDGDYEEEVFVESFFISKDNVDMYGTDGWQ